jgi:hypothetical protein
VLTLTASGSVNDYSDSNKASLQQKLADAAGVDKSLVTIRVAAASVRITATIAVPASMAADEVQTSLASTLGTADAASAALGLTIEEVPTIVVLAATLPLTPPSNSSDEPQSSCDGGCIGGVAGGCFVLLLVLVCTGWLSGGFAKTAAGAPRRPTPRSSRIMPQDERRHSRALVCDTSAYI